MSMINEFVEKLRGRLKKELQLADEDKRKADVLQFDRAVGYANGMAIAIDILNQLAEEYKDVPDTNVGKWIPVSEKLPDDYDNRFYMCIVENHEEDLPMFCQYAEDYGFGYWDDIYVEDSLGFLDSEFKTNDEFGYEKVIAWQPLPESYKGE